MRLITILILFTVLSCKENSSIQKSKDLELRLSLLKEYYVPYNGQVNYEPENDTIQEKVFQVRIALINNSDKEISLWMMSCSWWYNFLINNPYMFFADSIGCNANSAIPIAIGSKDSIIFNTRLSRDIQVDNPCKNCIGFYGNEVKETKLGLIIIDSTVCSNHYQFQEILHDKSKWDKILWSNSLYLLK